MPPFWLLKAGAVLALLAGVWLHGNHAGAAGVRARWQAQQVADETAANAQAEQQRLRARAAAADYETQRAALTVRLTQPSAEARNALHAPICPPAGPSPVLELGDVPVPAAVLQRLRDAGTDFTGGG